MDESNKFMFEPLDSTRLDTQDTSMFMATPRAQMSSFVKGMENDIDEITHSTGKLLKIYELRNLYLLIFSMVL